jgi:DNA-binding NarL/FixJ family response regulator
MDKRPVSYGRPGEFDAGMNREQAPLTPRQREIALLAATGLSNKQIGERLLLSPRTVSTHLYQLFPKLGVSSRAALRDALGRAGEEHAVE